MAATVQRRTGVGKLNDMRRLAETAKKLVAKNDVKVKQALEKAADVVDSKTKGKYSEKIEGAVAKAKEAVDKLPDRPPAPDQPEVPDQPEAPDQPDRETGPS
jgi:arginase family enzyme